MIRLSRLTDYGVILMAYFAKFKPGHVLTAREIAETVGIPLPTVSKLLKKLSGANLIVSHRGVNGGYCLMRSPMDISVVEMLEVLEGPLGLTDCSYVAEHNCDLESTCMTKNPWKKINQVIREALSALSLADMSRSATSKNPPKDAMLHVVN